MKVSRFNPQSVIQQAVKAAEQALERAGQGQGKIDQAGAKRLPAALQKVTDGFAKAGALDQGVGQAEVLRAFVQSLEAQLSGSLQRGELLPGEIQKALDLVNFSAVGLQLQQLMKAQAEPKTVAGTEAAARLALATADATATSQLEVWVALKAAADAHAAEHPKGAVAKVLGEVVKARGRILKGVADATVAEAEAAYKAKGPGSKEALQVALEAAHDVHKAISPRAARTKALKKQLDQLGAAQDLEKAATQPFFARFLENQRVKGEAPKVTHESKPGDMVTMKFPSDGEDGGPVKEGEDAPLMTKKFPSDAEDSGADGPSSVVTERYPSDAEDIGEGGDLDGVMTTRKYPSDNDEDATGEAFDPNMVTLKFPSDAEDNAPDRPDDPTFVTMKFPSDAEDHPLPELRPELIVEVAPELRPEMRPELIVEVAPELRPDGDLKPEQRQALRIEQGINKAAFHGEETLKGRIAEIDDLLTRARVSQPMLEQLQLEREALSLWLQGGPAIEKHVEELKRLSTVAYFSPEGYAKHQAKIELFSGLRGDIGVLEDRLNALARRRHHTTAESVEMAVVKAAFYGVDTMEQRQLEIHDLLIRARLDQPTYHRLTLEAEGLKAFRAGAPAIMGMLQDLDQAMLNFGGTVAEQKKLTDKRELLTNLLASLQAFENRSNELDRKLEGGRPELIPEIAPELRPELIPEIAPELRPELRPELIVEVAPELRPELRPELIVELAPELRPELRPELIPEIAPDLPEESGDDH